MGALLLLLTTFIWGTAFLAQKLGADTLGPFAMTCFRNLLGAAFLAVVIISRHSGILKSTNRRIEKSTNSLFPGFACGLPLFAAMVAQQIGIEYTTPGISSFLTANYIFFIPVIAFIVYRRRPRWYIVTGIALALVGTYLICMTGETMKLGKGELWTLACAFIFAIQMLTVERFAPKSDLLVLSATQLFTCFALALPFLFFGDEAARVGAYFRSLAGFDFAALKTFLPVFYCGVFSSGIAYTLQNVAQARTPAAVTGVILSMESVFGALSGYIVLGDRMTAAQFAGCALVFIAAVSTQLIDTICSR